MILALCCYLCFQGARLKVGYGYLLKMRSSCHLHILSPSCFTRIIPLHVDLSQALPGRHFPESIHCWDAKYKTEIEFISLYYSTKSFWHPLIITLLFFFFFLRRVKGMNYKRAPRTEENEASIAGLSVWKRGAFSKHWQI